MSVLYQTESRPTLTEPSFLSAGTRERPLERKSSEQTVTPFKSQSPPPPLSTLVANPFPGARNSLATVTKTNPMSSPSPSPFSFSLLLLPSPSPFFFSGPFVLSKLLYMYVGAAGLCSGYPSPPQAAYRHVASPSIPMRPRTIVRAI
ncbi:hypothetical protein LX32DRAFT_312317 [Colletotrichum zoysiae]|uniref:Uncharacterized protein n=1 Tax=Colletotrichum zoysiae TaxID=1216348 RepID=A0AAD9HK99_9PEZI|nr:hypothetical protein LX32DRAFT_312317 [Colletotrichum zoysiae]